MDGWMETVKLEFTTAVLGKEVADKLRQGKITQTIRSRKSTAPFFQKRGSVVDVTLDGKFLYRARITEIASKLLNDLSTWDADIGGFDSILDLQRALKKAGFRFKPLQDYSGFRIGFLKQGKKE